jgi:hypothetical protein
MSFDNNGNSVWSSGDPISNLIAPPPPTTPTPQPDPSPQVIPAPTPKDDQSRQSEQNKQYLHDNQHFDAGNGTYLHISMAPPDLLAAANAQAEKLYPSNPYFGNSQFGQNHPKAAQVISNMLLGLSAYNPGNEPQSAGQSAAQVARMALAPQAYAQRTNLERNDFVNTQVNAARAQQAAQTEQELKLAQIAKDKEGTPVGEPREDGQGGTFQIMNTPKGLISVPYPVQRPNSPNVIAPNPSNQNSSQGTPVAGTIAAPPTSGSSTSNAPYGTPLGQKPSEEDKALMDYMQTSGLPNTPQGREQARTDLFYRQHPSDAPIGSDGAASKNAIITSQLKKAGIDASLYNVSATDSVTAANAKQSAAEKALSDQRAQQNAVRVANAPVAAQQRKDSTTMGYAMNQTTGELEYMSKADADKQHSTFEEMKPAEVNKDRQAVRQLNDVQKNVSQYTKAARDYDQANLPTSVRAGDQARLHNLLNKAGITDFKVTGIAEIDIPGVSALAEAGSRQLRTTDYQNLSPQGKALYNGYLRTMAAVPAYQKALTGVGRTNKEVMELELNMIPNPTLDAKDILDKQSQFQENVERASEGFPTNLPGLKTTKQVRQETENSTNTNTQGGFAAWKKSQGGNQ